MPKVKGRQMETATTEPSPGRAPITIPMRTPRKFMNRGTGENTSVTAAHI